MKKGLNKRTVLMDDNDMVNVFELTTKKIVYTGNLADVALFLGVPSSYAMWYLQTKTRFHKKYALRRKPNL